MAPAVEILCVGLVKGGRATAASYITKQLLYCWR